MRVVRGHARDDLGDPWLWYALLAPPLAWLLHVAGMYPLVPAACTLGGTAILHGFTVLTALPILLAWWVAHRAARDTADRTDASGRRAHFLARSALISSPLFLAITLAEWLPVLVHDPCQ